MKDAVFSGSDLAAAVQEAEQSLGLRGDQIHYVVIDPGSPATSGRAATPVRIAVMLDAHTGGPKSARDEGGGRHDEPRAHEREPAMSPEDAAAEFGASVETVGEAFSAALQAPLSLAVDRQGERIRVGISGEGAAALEDADGETLLALETVLQRIAGRCGETARVVVANPARKSLREASLRAEALRLAADVKERGLPRMMPPLNSYERRVVHMVLAEVEGIKTYSVGDGMERRLTIALSSENTAE